MERILFALKQIIPHRLFVALQPYYHLGLSFLGALRYGFPSRKIIVIGVTGTKGKSTVTELTTAMLQAQGYKVASLSTIRFKVGDTERRNLYKMTMPGRFFVQGFLREAVKAGCTHAVIEMTSEGAKQHRHRFIAINALVFTNLTPEHIESHGSFANYKAAKLRLAEAVYKSAKRPRIIVANIDDEHGNDFLAFPVERTIGYRLSDLQNYSLHQDGSTITLGGRSLRIPLVGLFNVYNVLAALTVTKEFGVTLDAVEKALKELTVVKGRVEHFRPAPGAKKQLTVIVDYAHTPDSLRQLYEAFPNVAKVGVLGNTGGGRDTWKRPEMGRIAERYCDHIILTNEDPYDEDPRKIVEEMARGIQNQHKLTIIMDRKEAIAFAIDKVRPGGYVIVSGKGTDPYIMGPNNTKEPWSDASVVTELLQKLSA